MKWAATAPFGSPGAKSAGRKERGNLRSPVGAICEAVNELIHLKFWDEVSASVPSPAPTGAGEEGPEGAR
jgi:hypothetical protein